MNNQDFNFVPSFSECKKIVESNSAFLCKEDLLNDHKIVSFVYRLASYSDFCIPGARNIRGITFDKDSEKIVALPFHKFFNYKENPFTEDKVILNKNISLIRDKTDGSLIMFFMIDNVLYAKTKMTCMSEQSTWAMDIVNNNESLKQEIIDKIINGYTPMFEFVSPRNRIVILYDKEELVYLGSRNMLDGTYDFEPLKNCKSVEEYKDVNDVNSIINILKNVNNKEGVVVVFSDDEMIKIKTDDYIKLHHAKNDIFNEKYLAELVITENLDDIRSLFIGDETVMNFINSNEHVIKNKYIEMINTANEFFNQNKNLERKDYAIKAKKEVNSVIFNLAMNLYVFGKIDTDKFNNKFVNDTLWK